MSNKNSHFSVERKLEMAHILLKTCVEKLFFREALILFIVLRCECTVIVSL